MLNGKLFSVNTGAVRDAAAKPLAKKALPARTKQDFADFFTGSKTELGDSTTSGKTEFSSAEMDLAHGLKTLRSYFMPENQDSVSNGKGTSFLGRKPAVSVEGRVAVAQAPEFLRNRVPVFKGRVPSGMPLSGRNLEDNQLLAQEHKQRLRESAVISAPVYADRVRKKTVLASPRAGAEKSVNPFRPLTRSLNYEFGGGFNSAGTVTDTSSFAGIRHRPLDLRPDQKERDQAQAALSSGSGAVFAEERGRALVSVSERTPSVAQEKSRSGFAPEKIKEMAVRVARHKQPEGIAPGSPAQIIRAAGLKSPGEGDKGVGGEIQRMGALAARFESGDEGIAAIGYDAVGGTSYGTFQISSRAGTMKRFIGYLQEKSPEIAQRLMRSGPANTGGKGGRMPEEWRRIAQEMPERFETLQHDFVRESHFEPALEGIAKETGVLFDRLPEAFKEVLFSTAVHHGPTGAVRIVGRALRRIQPFYALGAAAVPLQLAAESGAQLIKNIYDIRAGQFRSSSQTVQSAVKNRLREEMSAALAMFQQHGQFETIIR